MDADNTNFAKKKLISILKIYFEKFDLSVFRWTLYNTVIKLLFPPLLFSLILILALALAFWRWPLSRKLSLSFPTRQFLFLNFFYLNPIFNPSLDLAGALLKLRQIFLHARKSLLFPNPNTLDYVSKGIPKFCKISNRSDILMSIIRNP
jgi:hypothetical protein